MIEVSKHDDKIILVGDVDIISKLLVFSVKGTVATGHINGMETYLIIRKAANQVIDIASKPEPVIGEYAQAFLGLQRNKRVIAEDLERSRIAKMATADALALLKRKGIL